VACESTSQLPWFAVVVKPQHERSVQEGLLQKNVESFLPTYWASRRWSDRVKRIQLPLFPGYVFCRFDYALRQPVVCTPGVRSIISFGAQAIAVPNEEISAIRRMVASGYFIEPWPFLKEGQRVRVNEGPLVGLEGTLTELRGASRVVVGLELLQRSVAVQMARDQVAPV
jgi:transcription antitermination factor NusG